MSTVAWEKNGVRQVVRADAGYRLPVEAVGATIFTVKSIADGQVGTSQAAIYTVPLSTVAVVTQVAFYNTNAAQQTLRVWIKRAGGTARSLRQFVLAQAESLDLLDDGDTLELSAGDAIEASTTTGSAVDFIILGNEGV